ncbi:MAG: LLM class flavin-dependent oxidoreductase, partial [Acidimicrobiales bacterium]
FYYGESPNDLNLECWGVLAALARMTSTIRLGPVIANVLPAYRSLVLLSRQAATADAVAGGRIDFRTGVGASASYGRAWWGPVGVEYPLYSERLIETASALEALPDLWAPDRSIPITVAATGPRAMDLAAVRADVWETSFCTPTEFASRRADLMARLEGRSMVCSLEIDGFVASSDRAVKRLLDRVRADRGGTEDLDPILARALVGQPSEVATRLAELEAVGVDQVVVALHDPHDLDGLEALSEARRLMVPVDGLNRSC